MALSRFQRRRRLALAAALLAAGLALLFVTSANADDMHEMVEAIGLGLIVVGIVGRMWCTLYIGGRKAAEIVTLGPYSLSRNPLYVFSTIAAAGVGAQSGSVFLAVLFLLASWFAFTLTIRREEVYLSERFGETYRTYKTRVPRFWPKLKGFVDAETLVVPSRRLYVTMLDGLVFFVAAPIFEIVEGLQASGALQPILRLY